MKVNIAIKSISKTRNIETKLYEISDSILTLKDLIQNIVEIEVNNYEKDSFKSLSQNEINLMVDQGKIAFGFKYREDSPVDKNEAKGIAIDAFKDGIFHIFLNNDNIENLEDEISLHENDTIAFIRLTMLSGRYF